MKLFKKIKKSLSIAHDLLHATWQIIRGHWKILNMPQPCVSIFGSSRINSDSFYAQEANRIGTILVTHGISVLTGGGPGIMEAANRGANAKGGNGHVRTMKIGIRNLPGQEPLNPTIGEEIIVNNFFARKWLLIDYSIGFVVFPGGFGTMDELSELLNLMQTGKIHQRIVILIGTEFWKPYLEWIDGARISGYFHHQEPKVIATDDIESAADHIIAYCKNCARFTYAPHNTSE